MPEELIEKINELDPSCLLTYFWGSIFITIILFICFIIVEICVGIYIKQKKERYLNTLDEHTKTAILKYKDIGLFTKEKKDVIGKN